MEGRKTVRGERRIRRGKDEKGSRRRGRQLVEQSEMDGLGHLSVEFH